MQTLKTYYHPDVTTLEEKTIFTRLATRSIVIKRDTILLLYTQRYEDYSLSGGGLDEGEDLTLINTLDDVDDFHLYEDIPEVGYTRTISVVSAGVDFGVVNEQAKRITVTVTSPQGVSMSLTSYRFNF